MLAGVGWFVWRIFYFLKMSVLPVCLQITTCNIQDASMSMCTSLNIFLSCVQGYVHVCNNVCVCVFVCAHEITFTAVQTSAPTTPVTINKYLHSYSCAKAAAATCISQA